MDDSPGRAERKWWSRRKLPEFSQKDRRTDFDRSQSRAWELVVMELGELLYNKSEYIETVRVARHLPSPLQACVL